MILSILTHHKKYVKITKNDKKQEILKMFIGIIGAMDVEVEGLKAIMDTPVIEEISSVKYYIGKIKEIKCVVAEAGVGKVNAAVCTQTMILKYKPDVIINIGVAGSLSTELSTGDIAIANKVVEHDMDTSAVGDELGFITGINTVYMDCDKQISELLYNAATKIDGLNVKTGIIASGDQFIASQEQRDRIINNFNAIAAEMEGGSIGHVCTMAGVRFGVLRAISDGANGNSSMDFPAFAKMAAQNSINIILNLMEELA